MRRISQTLTVKQAGFKLLLVLSLLWTSIGMSQISFTEDPGTYNLDIAEKKDGGHAWADYDLDGDFDLEINTG